MRLGKQVRSQKQAQLEFQQLRAGLGRELVGTSALVSSRNSRLSGLSNQSLDGQVSGTQHPPTETLPGAPSPLTGRRCGAWPEAVEVVLFC